MQGTDGNPLIIQLS